MLPIYRYPLDPTGENPNNAVVGELHTLSNKQNRVVIPTFNPIFSKGLVVYDATTNVQLQRGVDYLCIGFMQEASLKLGQEVVSAIIITNQNISSQVKINYQVVGGLYTNKSNLIYQLYEDVLNDERPVDWVNILNKPSEYTPALHKHLLMDVVGFESVVNSLERISDAITMSNIPAYERMIDLILKLRLTPATAEDLYYEINQDRVITIESLKVALQYFDYNTLFLSPNVGAVRRGDWIDFKLAASNMDDSIPLFWSILHVTTTDEDFPVLGGRLELRNGQTEFTVKTIPNDIDPRNLIFRIQIKKVGTDGPVLRTSGKFYLETIRKASAAKMMLAYSPTDPFINISPTGLFVINH